MDVTSPKEAFIFNSNITQAIFKDTNNTTVETENLSILVLKGQSATLRINCTLASGNYTITLLTAADGCFVSPMFTIL
jgi:hypothetical protein